MKIHGVSTDFLRALKHAGYDLASRQIAELKIHGVSADYMRDLNIYGLKPQAADLVQMKIHGIDPEYLKSQGRGLRRSLRQPDHRAQDPRLDPKFIQEAKDLGYDSPRELIDLKIHGVSATTCATCATRACATSPRSRSPS